MFVFLKVLITFFLWNAKVSDNPQYQSCDVENVWVCCWDSQRLKEYALNSSGFDSENIILSHQNSWSVNKYAYSQRSRNTKIMGLSASLSNIHILIIIYIFIVIWIGHTSIVLVASDYSLILRVGSVSFLMTIWKSLSSFLILVSREIPENMCETLNVYQNTVLEMNPGFSFRWAMLSESWDWFELSLW